MILEPLTHALVLWEIKITFSWNIITARNARDVPMKQLEDDHSSGHAGTRESGHGEIERCLFIGGCMI